MKSVWAPRSDRRASRSERVIGPHRGSPDASVGLERRAGSPFRKMVVVGHGDGLNGFSVPDGRRHFCPQCGPRIDGPRGRRRVDRREGRQTCRPGGASRIVAQSLLPAPPASRANAPDRHNGRTHGNVRSAHIWPDRAPAARPGSVWVPLGRVAEWQTCWLQVPVRATSWGFKSPLAHRKSPRQRRIAQG